MPKRRSHGQPMTTFTPLLTLEGRSCRRLKRTLVRLQTSSHADAKYLDLFPCKGTAPCRLLNAICQAPRQINRTISKRRRTPGTQKRKTQASIFCSKQPPPASHLQQGGTHQLKQFFRTKKSSHRVTMPTSSTLTAIALLALPIALFCPSPIKISPILNSINPCLVPGTCVTPLQLNLLLDQVSVREGIHILDTINVIEQLQNPNITFIDWSKAGHPHFRPDGGVYCPGCTCWHEGGTSNSIACQQECCKQG
jgi:hypothetical protein